MTRPDNWISGEEVDAAEAEQFRQEQQETFQQQQLAKQQQGLAMRQERRYNLDDNF